MGACESFILPVLRRGKGRVESPTLVICPHTATIMNPPGRFGDSGGVNGMWFRLLGGVAEDREV